MALTIDKLTSIQNVNYMRVLIRLTFVFVFVL